MYYKLCNMYYKLSNMRYKLCNKLFLAERKNSLRRQEKNCLGLVKNISLKMDICRAGRADGHCR